ncbi:MAG TPA: hypothetical protein ENN85_04570 [Methanoculleus sp.]|nr:hypothetical protein [Methanoculleus sp.]
MCRTGGGITKRWALSLILLAGSLLVSLLAFLAGFPFFFFFLFIPFIPLFKPPKQRKKCPVCGWETTGAERYCPYDGSLLAGAERGFDEGEKG